MTEPIRVLLADDHSVVREGIGLILSVEDDLEVVGQVADGAAAADFVATHPVDVVLMDIQMPGTDGIEGTRRIVGSGAACGVVMLTTFERDDYLFDSIEAGASGFLLKNADPDVLVDAVRAVHAGQALLSPEVTLQVLRRVAGHGARESAGTHAEARHGGGPTPSGTSTPRPTPTVPDLTPREHEVLVRLAEGMSNHEIAAALFVSEATVKTHLSNVLSKLGARDRAQAIVAAFRLGIVSA